ncbi:uncharacterized protein PG998_005245 [Apiospora kogelbergensis]|uniref:uncharacterized protein n=1 Tax=Apiospora kogelbergensis TaxID=1337665 RepID=UPI0031327848
MLPIKASSSTTNSQQSDDSRPDIMHDFPDDSIAVVGAGCRLPGANDLEDLWQIISQGQSRLEKLRPERCNPHKTYRAVQDPAWIARREFYGNFLDDAAGFDRGLFGISPREAAHMDPQQRLLLETAFEAMDSSGYLHGHRRERGDPVGCFVGASYTEYQENTNAYAPSAYTATGTIRAFLSGKISYHFGWTGPSEVIDTACSASLVAIHRACRAIQAGECTMALAGGVNLITGVNNYFDLAKAGFLSTTGQCKPFDDAADGYCRADGVCLVVLKPLRQAIADRDDIMGVIPAVATNQGGVHASGITVPDGSCQKALYRTLLKRSGLTSDDVSYMEAHGTGTRVGDPIEMASIREVFGGSQRTDPLYVGSLKSNIGHSETAAGAAGLLKLNRNIPPLESDKIIIPTDRTPWSPQGGRVACVSSYGASGSNSALLCAEWRGADCRALPKDLVSSKSMSRCPILLSAATQESLLRQARDLAQYLSNPIKGVDLINVAFTLSQRRKHHRFRWSALTKDMSGLADQLQDLDAQHIISHPKTTKNVVLTFSGQSGTKIGLDPSILRDNPRFAHYVQSCNQILMGLGCTDIISIIHQSEIITDPTLLQCGLVTIQYACARCWIDGGLEVAGIVGHSLGELVALAVSGVLSLEDMLRVVYTRAQLIERKMGAEKGAMVAIHSKLETVKAVMEAARKELCRGDDLEIACYNSHTSHVVVGSEKGIQATLKVLKNDACYSSIRYHCVDVTHGFHSRLVEPLIEGLSQLGKTIVFHQPKIQIETSTREPINFGDIQRLGYLANHARQPVYFVDAVRRLEAGLGPCIWLEAGLGTPVVPMTRRATASPELHTFQSVTVPEAAAADIWREGVAITSWRFLDPEKSDLHSVWLPPYRFDHSKDYWLEHVDHAVKEREGAATDGRLTKADPSHDPPRLVTYDAAGTAGESGPHVFHLHTDTQRYARIVQGHSVRGKPLCPASVYMEAAIMALTLLGSPVRGGRSPFGTPFSAGHLATATAYQLFSRVVEYAGLMQGIVNITLGPREAVAKVRVPKTTFPASESTVMDFYDAITLDAFIQVLGLLVNHSNGFESTETDDIYVASSIGKMELTPVDFDTTQVWTAYAEYVRLDGKTTSGNVFVRSDKGDVMFSVTDVRFVRVSATAMERLLETANPTTNQTDLTSQIHGGVVSGHTSHMLKETGGKPNLQRKDFDATLHACLEKASDTRNVESQLTTLVSSYTGVAVEDIQADATLCSMGLDSLASIELADEIEAELNFKMDTEDLGSESVRSLLAYLSASDDGASSTFQSGSSTILTTPSFASDDGEQINPLQDPQERTETPIKIGKTTVKWVRPKQKLESRYTIEQHAYKEVDELEILADIYIPTEAHNRPRCVALMIHGGGHLTLSRRAVRPRQTKFLLASGLLPVSVDYRLCPQVNVLDGAMTDVRDACIWAQKELPEILESRGVIVDRSRYVVIGWSTGGTLAMTTAWSVHDAGFCSPTAILAFYCPVEYDPKEPITMGRDHGHRTMSLKEIQRRLPAKPVYSDKFIVPSYQDRTACSEQRNRHHQTRLDKAGRPTPELVLALIKENRGMSILFNDDPLDRLLGANGTEADQLPYPDATRAAAFSPLVHLRCGSYRTPTCLVFGDSDEIAPFGKAVEFVQAMKQQGVRGDLLVAPDAKHIFDLDLVPGSEGWKSYVEPGYEFLLNELGDAGSGDL